MRSPAESTVESDAAYPWPGLGQRPPLWGTRDGAELTTSKAASGGR